VLVVGSGQAGLASAARLTQLQADTLIVDRESRIGDNWRKRYHALVLHNQVHVKHWFIVGSFARCRIYSKYLGLLIKACEVGLLPECALRVGVQR